MQSEHDQPSLTLQNVGSKILIIEDHPMIANGMVALFTSKSNLPKIFVEDSLKQGISKVKDDSTTGPFDLVLLDLGLPGHFGLSAFWSFREHCPEVPVAAFSGMNDPEQMRQLLRGGARGFVPKSLAPDLILGAVQLMLSGGVFIPIESLDARTDQISSDDPLQSRPLKSETFVSVADPHNGINNLDPLLETIMLMPPRRRDVLRLLAEGYSNKEICRAQGVSLNTVKTHVALIYSGLMLNSRHELMLLLMKHQLLPKLREKVGSEPHPTLASTRQGPQGAPLHSAWPLK
jgi:DNA-binding NarL/FixJ family response regulator